MSIIYKSQRHCAHNCFYSTSKTSFSLSCYNEMLKHTRKDYLQKLLIEKEKENKKEQETQQRRQQKEQWKQENYLKKKQELQQQLQIQLAQRQEYKQTKENKKWMQAKAQQERYEMRNKEFLNVIQEQAGIFITRENLDAKIKDALNNPTNYNVPLESFRQQELSLWLDWDKKEKQLIYPILDYEK